MAGGKETPRQKMIGLMYLVLMALLAMNVSKEIINAFITLDGKLQTSNQAFQAKSGAAYTRVMTANATSSNEVNKFWLNKADKVKGYAAAIDNYIFDLKATMLAEATEGPGADKSRWTETLEDGTVVIKDLLDEEDPYGKKDDYDTPTRMFGGVKGTQGFDKGAEIRERIHSYRDSLIQELSYGYKGKPVVTLPIESEEALKDQLKNMTMKSDTTTLLQIYRNLTQPETMKNHGEDQAWQLVMFDHAPIVAASAMFTSIQNDIRDNEATALEFIASKVEAPPVKFNKVAAIPVGKQYVNQGDSLDVKVIIAAWDTMAQVKAGYWVNDTTMNEDNKQEASPLRGKAGIKIPATAVGPQRLDGYVLVQENGKDVRQYWSFDYEVGAPNATVSPADLQVLYRGWDNKLEVAAGGYPPEAISVSCSGCSVSKKGEFYIAKTSGNARSATISISANVDGKSVPVAKKEFRIFNLPTPSAFFANQTFDRPTIKSGLAKQGTKLIAKLGDSPLKVDYAVTSFEMSVPAPGGKTRVLRSRGPNLSSEMRQAIAQMRPGAMLTFSNIRARKQGSSKDQPVPSLSFRLI